MKKIALICLLGLATLGVNAQTDQGTLFVGGGLGFNSTTSKKKSNNTTIDEPKNTLISVSPGVGYFVADKLAVGFDLNYENGTTTTKTLTGDVKTKNNTFGITPYVRYYFMTGDNFGFTGTFGVNYAQGKSKTEGGGRSIDGETNTNLSVGITPGIVYFPSEKIGIEANFGFFGYASQKTKEPGNNAVETTDTQFGLGLNSLGSDAFGIRRNGTGLPLGLQFAFRYYFGGK